MPAIVFVTVEGVAAMAVAMAATVIDAALVGFKHGPSPPLQLMQLAILARLDRLAAISCTKNRDVRFTPKSGHRWAVSRCPLCADFVAEVLDHSS